MTKRGCIHLWAIDLQRNMRGYWPRMVLGNAWHLRLKVSSLRGSVHNNKNMAYFNYRQSMLKRNLNKTIPIAIKITKEK